jgi:hypothetical protein
MQPGVVAEDAHPDLALADAHEAVPERRLDQNIEGQ